MRHGHYAVLDGVEYPVRVDRARRRVSVVPAGRTPGRWPAEVSWDRIDRLVHVATWALVDGRFPVEVGAVRDDGTVLLRYCRTQSPLGDPPREDPPGFRGHPAEHWVDGVRHLAELTDVREVVTETPLVPTGVVPGEGCDTCRYAAGAAVVGVAVVRSSRLGAELRRCTGCGAFWEVVGGRRRVLPGSQAQSRYAAELDGWDGW